VKSRVEEEVMTVIRGQGKEDEDRRPTGLGSEEGYYGLRMEDGNILYGGL